MTFHTFKFPEIGRLTASIGVTGSTAEKDPIELLNRAEFNMNEAVSLGKDQIVADAA